VPHPERALDQLIQDVYLIVSERIGWQEWLLRATSAFGVCGAQLDLRLSSETRTVTTFAEPPDHGATLVRESDDGSVRLTLYASGHTVDADTIDRLLSHAQRAAGLASEIDVDHHLVQAVADAIADSIGVGIVLLERRTGRVVFINRHARSIVRDHAAIELACDRLEFRDRETRASFERALRTVDTSTLVTVSAAPSITLIVHRLDRCAASFTGRDPHRWAIAFIIAPGSREFLRPDHLAATWGLTPKETRLVHGLISGRSIDQLAAVYSVSAHTLRAQLKSARRKTNCTSQTQLLRTILEDPLALFDSETAS
jgi:DNA-binding CsgD family transcriptional regulator